MAPEIDRTPPYLQVVSALRKQIVGGDLNDGDRIPSVRQLADEWSISQATAMKAVAALRADGLVESVTGVGTIVRTQSNLHRSAGDRFGRMLSTGKIYAPGEYARIVSAGMAVPSTRVADHLGIDEGAEAVRRHRITYNDAGPIGASTSWFAPELAELVPALLSTERIPGGTPSAIEAVTGQRAANSSDTSTAAAATQDQAAELGIEPGSPVTIGHNVLRDTDGGVIEVGEYVSAGGRWTTVEHNYS
ncbi:MULTISPECIES: GntR family transcriptional regulator [unclassified Streptomyces]|uniref:GntR family transcriptional regulator n=1 Tax=unclassified Streptomyces TaxID=2593676 RepID=UPI0003611EFA|nr:MULTISPECIES: GntR family transcriptional regulator [unclassified Streptomyces]MYS37223.1 GntR family transcriptional regulator [Streptomyces sp. SID4920]MYX64265.1 GntR family transcriptional regulator [Streptomyces sp. SID8373]